MWQKLNDGDGDGVGTKYVRRTRAMILFAYTVKNAVGDRSLTGLCSESLGNLPPEVAESETRKSGGGGTMW